MPTYTSNAEKRTDDRTDPRPNHFELGVDVYGSVHHASTTGTDDAILVIYNGRVRERHTAPDGGRIDFGAYMRDVRAAGGWAEETYGTGLCSGALV